MERSELKSAKNNRKSSAKTTSRSKDQAKSPTAVQVKPGCKVKIVAQYSNKLPFEKLHSRIATAVVLSYYGNAQEVDALMQKLNHISRAYFINAKQLQGFLAVSYSVTGILKKVSEIERLEVCKYQELDQQIVIQSLQQQQSLEEQIDFLEKKYPCLAIFVMQQLEMKEALAKYTNKCRNCVSSIDLYSLYVHGYFIPWLRQQRAEGKMKQGEWKGKIPGQCGIWKYKGEQDNKMRPHGEGTATSLGEDKTRYKGTWLNGAWHGVGRQPKQIMHQLLTDDVQEFQLLKKLNRWLKQYG